MTHVFYKNLHRADRMFGLELIDVYILLLFFNLSFFVYSAFALVNIVATGIIFIVLRIYKKNKPANYTTALFHYWRLKKILIIPVGDIVPSYPHGG